MNLKLIFSIYGVYSAIMGLFFIFLPSTAMEGAGVTPTPDLIGTQQIWGAYILGVGIIAWSLRGADGNDALKGTAKSFIVVCSLAVIVTIYHLYQGFGGPPIYVNIVVQFLCAVAIWLKTK